MYKLSAAGHLSHVAADAPPTPPFLQCIEVSRCCPFFFPANDPMQKTFSLRNLSFNVQSSYFRFMHSESKYSRVVTNKLTGFRFSSLGLFSNILAKHASYCTKGWLIVLFYCSKWLGNKLQSHTGVRKMQLQPSVTTLTGIKKI